MRTIAATILSLVVIFGMATLAAAGLSTGLIAYYPMQNNTNDYSGYGQNGTPNGTVGYAPGVFGQAISLGGAGWVSLPYMGDSNEGTIVGWVKWSAFNNWSRFFDFGTQGNAIQVVNSETSSILMYDLHFGDETNVSVMALTLDSWYHIALTTSKTAGARIYVNGVTESGWGAGLYESFYSLLTTDNYFLGKSNWGADALFNGLIDEVCIYNRVLSQGEIQQLMNTPNPVPLPGAAWLLGSGLLGLAGWRLRKR